MDKIFNNNNDNIFQLPIFYNPQKKILSKSIIKDLELISCENPELSSIHHILFQDSNIFSQKVVKELSPTYYTTDIFFLKDTQHLLKHYSDIKQNNDNKNNDKIDELKEKIHHFWQEIKTDISFKDKYGYLTWDFCEFLNHSDIFLQIMTFYNISSPLVSFLMPVILAILPFFIIQFKGMHLSISQYTHILTEIAKNHAIGKLFTSFHQVSNQEKTTIVFSALFYLFTIYQNVLFCIRFCRNMTKIYHSLTELKEYVTHSLEQMTKYLSFSQQLESYQTFNEKIFYYQTILKDFHKKLDSIKPNFSFKNMNEFGNVLKIFYDIYLPTGLIHDAFNYSFFFNGYIDCIGGLANHLNKGTLNFCQFSNKETHFKQITYPAIDNTIITKNNVSFDKNIIITGPNASGKTTLLKSVLLNMILSQQWGCGSYHEETIISPINYFHCYLNIPDTSGRDSLFEAEARRCKEILDHIAENGKEETHLCVFDELYSGTNPDEAVIAGTALMKYLVKQPNVQCFLTTHYTDMCKKLNKNKRIQNMHMDIKIDLLTEDFKYTYRLKKGVSFVKGGMNVLRNLNYPKELLKK
jgi:energy-coupling factor transporter ATP-binding protein EcfA2